MQKIDRIGKCLRLLSGFFFKISYFFAWLDCKRLRKSQYVMKCDLEVPIVFQVIDP